MERELRQNQLKSFFELHSEILMSPQGIENLKNKKKQKSLFRDLCPHFSEKTETQESASHLPGDTQLSRWQPH